MLKHAAPLLAALAWGLAGALSAQEAESTVREEVADGGVVEIPKPPHLAALPRYARYEMRLKAPVPKPAPTPEPGAAETPGKPRAQEPAMLVRLAITKLDDCKNVVETMSDGKSRSLWLRQGLALLRLAGGQTACFNPVDIGMQRPQTGEDFSGLGWLSAQTWAGTVLVAGKKCHVYESGGQRVWVDAASRLPLLLKEGRALYQFDYPPPPAEGTTWPAEFDEGWRQYKLAIRAVTGTSGAR